MSESQKGAGNLKTWKTWKFENIKNDPWDMLNNFSFHVYAQKLLFIGEMSMLFFDTKHTLSTDITVSRSGS